MGQILHGCAATTHAVRAPIQRSKAPIQELAEIYGLNPRGEEVAGPRHGAGRAHGAGGPALDRADG